MSQVRFAHLQDQGINFAVFAVDAIDQTNAGRGRVLADLTSRVRRQGLRVDKSALAFTEFGRLTFYGTKDLVDYLSSGWTPHWTHTLNT